MNNEGSENEQVDEDVGGFLLFSEPTEEAKTHTHSMLANQSIWNYFQSLLDDPRWHRHIAYIRKYNLDDKGNPENEEGLRKVATRLCRNWGLDEIFWTDELCHYILTSEIPKENLSTSCIVFDREDMGENEYPDGYYVDEYDDEGPMKEPVELDPWSYSHPVIIRVSPYASQREIVDYVKKAYSNQIKPIQERYREEGVNLGKVRKRKVGIRKRNNFIYENRKLTKKDLMGLVNKEFGEMLDYAYIAKIITTETKKVSNREIK